ncbi:hypothetical protein KAI19_04240 [bacterium]|nr:hypothetical protein [bacterium]
MTTFIRQIFGFAGCFLLLSHLCAYVLRRYKERAFYRWTVIALPLFLLVLPVGVFTVAEYMRGIVGELSMITLFIMGAVLWHRLGGKRLIDSNSLRFLQIAVITGGILLYPMTLGVTMMDPYRFGYLRGVAPLLMILIALGAWGIKRRAAAFVIILTLLLFHLRIMESTNLWDYCLDPFLFLYFCVSLLFTKYIL